MPRSVPEFLDLLQRSRLVPEEELNDWRQRGDQLTASSSGDRSAGDHSTDDNGQSKPPVVQLAHSIVESGRLTSFQARYLLHRDTDGLVIGGHRLCEPISRGGMGRVFLVEDLESGERRAMKTLRHSRTRALTLARFRLEALACQSLSHPNLVRGLAFDCTDADTWYLLMELIPGPNLREYRAIRKGISWREACSITRMVSLGLQAAHDAKIVHRDVKPQNILLHPSGDAKVIDFGLALYQGDDPSYISLPTSRAGTDEFIAPEQVRGDASVDHRADIYGLGCTFFFALTGQSPFPATSKKERRLAHVRRAPPRAGEFVPELPEDIESLLQAMLAKQPEERPASMQEVATALDAFAKRRRSIRLDYSALLRARNRRLANQGLTTAYSSAPDETPQVLADEHRREGSRLPADTLEALVTSLSHTLRQQREEASALRKTLTQRDAEHREALDESVVSCQRQGLELDTLRRQVKELEEKLEQESAARRAAEEQLRDQQQTLSDERQRAVSVLEELEMWKVRCGEAEQRSLTEAAKSDTQLAQLRLQLQQVSRAAQSLTDEIADLGNYCGNGELADDALRRAYESECAVPEAPAEQEEP